MSRRVRDVFGPRTTFLSHFYFVEHFTNARTQCTPRLVGNVGRFCLDEQYKEWSGALRLDLTLEDYTAVIDAYNIVWGFETVPVR
ncbi:hypothetical protein PQX77_018008 [Marasmius sp. AFHP31]|nr:hypothetical protein PQX77_018008 [Marasmius sp. AFHP31]